MENEPGDKLRLHAVVEGRVQGVGFRYFVEETALALNITGWVCNRWNGTVETIAEGERPVLEKFQAALQRGPRSAHVSHVSVEWLPATNEFSRFKIKMTE